MPFVNQLIQSIDGRIRELNSEISTLEQARSALKQNGSAPSPSRRPEAKPVVRRRATTKRTRRKTTSKRSVLLADTAERMLVEHDGLTTGALAKEAEADRDQVLTLLRELEAARRVRRTGQRRSTRWHAVTDEDRIRERAAELASRSGARST